MAKYWCGTVEQCQLCDTPLTTVMYDAQILGGRWANICPICFAADRCRLGVGYGQKYERQPDGRWLKTAG